MNRFLAASREIKPEESFYLYLDELQFFKSRAVEELLINGRRYNIAVTIAHQYFAQMQDSFEDDTNEFGNTILGNVGSMIIGKLGMRDAKIFAEMMNGVMAEDFQSLAEREAFAQIVENFETKNPVKIQFIEKNLEK